MYCAFEDRKPALLASSAGGSNTASSSVRRASPVAPVFTSRSTSRAEGPRSNGLPMEREDAPSATARRIAVSATGASSSDSPSSALSAQAARPGGCSASGAANTASATVLASSSFPPLARASASSPRPGRQSACFSTASRMRAINASVSPRSSAASSSRPTTVCGSGDHIRTRNVRSQSSLPAPSSA